MAHMTSTGADCNDAECANVRIVTYVVTGVEGVSIDINIGTTLASAIYDVFPAPGGVTNESILDIPNSGRTTTTFHVNFLVQPTAGDILKFLIVE